MALSFWDALLWATCDRVGMRYLLTEDFARIGRVIGKVTYLDPFLPVERRRCWTRSLVGSAGSRGRRARAGSSSMAEQCCWPTGQRLNHLAALASIAVALTLIAAKLAVWLVTDSIVILTSLVDSGIDLLASLVTFVSLRQAAQPADRAHRYGHGKAEALGAFAQAGFVGGSALILASEAVQRLIAPQAISQGRVGIAVMLLAIALTGGLVLFQRAVVRRTGSVAIRADSLHYRGDLLMNLAVIARAAR